MVSYLCILARKVYINTNYKVVKVTYHMLIKRAKLAEKYLSMALQPFVRLFQFLDPTHRWENSLEEGPAHRKSATYTQDNTNRIKAHKHQCFKWHSNPRSQCLSRAVTVINREIDTENWNSTGMQVLVSIELFIMNLAVWLQTRGGRVWHLQTFGTRCKNRPKINSEIYGFVPVPWNKVKKWERTLSSYNKWNDIKTSEARFWYRYTHPRQHAKQKLWKNVSVEIHRNSSK
jgi:hypothetical protein